MEKLERVFGIGWPKTGTTTLATALQILGYRHHGQSTDLTHDLMEGRGDRIYHAAATHQSFEGWPWPLLYEEMLERFPGSKFILTTRPSDRWFSSYINMGRKTPPDALKEIRRFIYGFVPSETNQADMVARFERHNLEVRDYFKRFPGQFTVLDWSQGDGWEKLCGFLGRDVPRVPFPHRNRGEYAVPERCRNIFSSSPPDRVRRVIHRTDSGGSWFKATDPLSANAPESIRVIGSRKEFHPWARGNFKETIPETGVLVLDGGCTLDKDGWTLTKEGSLLVDFSWFQTEEEMKIHHCPTPPVRHSRRIAGSCLDLSSTWCAGNYAHWLLEAVGRLSVLELSGFKPDQFDHIRLPSGNFRQVSAVIDKIGLDRSKFITPQDHHTLFQFDTLVRPSFAGIPKQYHPCLSEFLRRKVDVQRSSDFGEKVFIRRRGNSRLLSNEREVESLLASYGFKTVDPSEAPFGSFTSAGVVVACHQAGLADLVFNPAGTVVLELIPSDHQHMYYQSVSTNGGHRYHCMICPSTQERCPQTAIGPSPHDFRADASVIQEFLEELRLEKKRS